jgi:hypothetical protein
MVAVDQAANIGIQLSSSGRYRRNARWQMRQAKPAMLTEVDIRASADRARFDNVKKLIARNFSRRGSARRFADYLTTTIAAFVIDVMTQFSIAVVVAMRRG